MYKQQYKYSKNGGIFYEIYIPKYIKTRRIFYKIYQILYKQIHNKTGQKEQRKMAGIC